MIYPIQLISMALFASDGEDTIDAWDASSGKPYFCLECKAPLKLKRGKKIFPHFYHLSFAPSCRLYSKSERHLLIQLHLQKILPNGETVLEKPFKSIQRIADVAWEKKKIIFEIQCSPISELEAKERVSEYRSMGFEVVWILDDKLFNKRHVSRSERYVRERSSYFISKEFIFYDQLEIIHHHKRLWKETKIPVDLSKPCRISLKKTFETIPRGLKSRLLNNIYMFKNDLIEKLLTTNLEKELIAWTEKENQAKSRKTNFKALFIRFVCNPYLAFLKNFLNENK
jgi:competence protein CoiA